MQLGGVERSVSGPICGNFSTQKIGFATGEKLGLQSEALFPAEVQAHLVLSAAGSVAVPGQGTVGGRNHGFICRHQHQVSSMQPGQAHFQGSS